MDSRHRHNISYSLAGTSDEAGDVEAFADTENVFDQGFRLKDPSMLAYRKEYPDDITLTILSVFPNLVVQQITNSLCTRQIQTRGPGEMDLYWTYFGFADDDEEMTRHRLAQANLVGPGRAHLDGGRRGGGDGPHRGAARAGRARRGRESAARAPSPTIRSIW